MTFPFYDGPRWSPDLLLDKIHHYWSISDLDHQKPEKETRISIIQFVSTISLSACICTYVKLGAVWSFSAALFQKRNTLPYMDQICTERDPSYSVFRIYPWSRFDRIRSVSNCHALFVCLLDGVRVGIIVAFCKWLGTSWVRVRSKPGRPLSQKMGPGVHTQMPKFQLIRQVTLGLFSN